MKTMIVFAVGVMLGCQPFVLASNAPAYVQSFDPEKGFKPAQKDLTEIFLQIAGSLEFYGSPEPYLRHMQKEHARIEALYQRTYGKRPQSWRPANLDETYLQTLAKSWNKLSPSLDLPAFSKLLGQSIRSSVAEPDLEKTLRQQQALTIVAMAGDNDRSVALDTLRAKLAERLGIEERPDLHPTFGFKRLTAPLYQRVDSALSPIDATRVRTVLNNIFVNVAKTAQSELEVGTAEWALTESATATRQTAYSVANETNLTPAERKQLTEFLAKDRFTKSDFPALERFYAGPYDKLSDSGKEQISRRAWAGTR